MAVEAVVSDGIWLVNQTSPDNNIIISQLDCLRWTTRWSDENFGSYDFSVAPRHYLELLRDITFFMVELHRFHIIHMLFIFLAHP